MKRLITLIVFILIIVSCKNEKNYKKGIQKSDFDSLKTTTKLVELENIPIVDSNNEKNYKKGIQKSDFDSLIKTTTKLVELENIPIVDSNKEYFDWSKSISLKKDLIAKLKSKDLQQDKIVVDYLTSLDKLIDDYNEKLFNKSDYKTLNSISFVKDENLDKSVLEFKKQVEKNGLKISSSEGMIFIDKNTNFIKSETLELLDPISVDFLNLYCQEVDFVCCEDAGIIISEKELVNRVYNWGNLIGKVVNSNYFTISKREFDNNISLVFMGLDNTPSFDFVTGNFNENSLNSMNEIIEQFPDSKAAKEFEIFCKLIKSENYKQTEKINKYFDEYFNISE